MRLLRIVLAVVPIGAVPAFGLFATQALRVDLFSVPEFVERVFLHGCFMRSSLCRFFGCSSSRKLFALCSESALSVWFPVNSQFLFAWFALPLRNGKGFPVPLSVAAGAKEGVFCFFAFVLPPFGFLLAFSGRCRDGYVIFG